MKRIITTISLLAILAVSLYLPVDTVQARPLFDTYTAQAGNDTLMNSATPAGNFSGAAVISVGENNAATRVDRSLIKFDLSSIPPNAIITSATLSLWITEDRSDNARDYKIYRVLRNWVDTQATWNTWTTGNNWTTAGAGSNGNDADLTTVWATTNFSATESVGTEKQFSLSTTEVKKLIDGTYTNYGWLIKADTENNDGYTFASFENATTGQRPKLVIVWEAPTATPTNTGTATATYTPTDTPTATATNTPTDTPTATPTGTSTNTPTFTPTETTTPTETLTPTISPTTNPCEYLATVTSSTWTNTAGTNDDVCTDNSVRMVWREPGAEDGPTIDIAFSTDTSATYQVVFNGYYTGIHSPVLQCYNGTDWETIATLTNELSDDETITVDLPPACNDGSPALRFYHAELGNAAHYINIDQLILQLLTSVPNWYLDPTITYGEYALNVALLALCGTIVILGLMIFIILLVRKKGMK